MGWTEETITFTFVYIERVRQRHLITFFNNISWFQSISFSAPKYGVDD